MKNFSLLRKFVVTGIFALAAVFVICGCASKPAPAPEPAPEAVEESAAPEVLVQGAVYLHADSGLKFDFVDEVAVDVFTDADSPAINSSYTYDSSALSGQITMPDDTPLGSFQLNSSGTVLTFTQEGGDTGLPLSKQE